MQKEAKKSLHPNAGQQLNFDLAPQKTGKKCFS